MEPKNSRKIKIGILGGSFNPPHQGHVHISEIVRKKLSLSKILWLVSPGNPLKDNSILQNFENRFQACKEITKKYPNIKISDLERKFYGLWTFEPELVKETVQLVIAHIKKYQPELANQLTAHLQTIQPQSATPEELGTVVARVVDYLKTEEKNTQPKSLDRNLISNEIQAFLRMAQIMDAADITNPMAAAEVMTLSETMAQMLELPAWQIKRLRLAGLLHRIDPLQRTESVLESTSTYQSDIPQVPPSCPLVPGTQVLRTMPRLRAIAQIITHQTECWDGSGKPAGLVGDEIPLESRILALAAEFQYRVNQQKKSRSNPEEIVTQALEECKQQSHHFDPKLLETLTLLVMGLQQGMELTVKIPKVSSNMWLLDEPLASNLMGEPINSSQS